MLPSWQAKARFPRICSLCLLCCFYSCKPRGRGLGLSLPLAEEADWVWGLSPLLLLSNSGTFPCLSQQRDLEGSLGMSRALLGIPWSHLTQSKGFAWQPPQEMPLSQSRVFPLLGSSQNTKPHCQVWDLGVLRAEVISFISALLYIFFCQALNDTTKVGSFSSWCSWVSHPSCAQLVLLPECNTCMSTPTHA